MDMVPFNSIIARKNWF